MVSMKGGGTKQRFCVDDTVVSEQAGVEEFTDTGGTWSLRGGAEGSEREEETAAAGGGL